MTDDRSQSEDWGQTSTSGRELITRRQVIGATSLGALGTLSGCLSAADDLTGSNTTTVTIGGKQFTEQLLLSWISSHLLTNAGFDVENKFPIGGNTANHEALVSGEVDHYWEYTGTGWNYHLENSDQKIRDPEELYRTVKQAYEEEYNVTCLNRAELNDTYVVTANPEWKQETGVDTLSDV